MAAASASYATTRGLKATNARRSQAARSARRSAAAPARVETEASMNIVFIAAEVAPWSKTGGLGDVVGGLPAALAARGHRVMTIAPRYDQYRDAWDTETEFTASFGSEETSGRFFHTYKRGVDRVFVDHPSFLSKVWGKTGSKIYGKKTGVDYEDNQLRFSLFCQAALKAPLMLNLDNNPAFSGVYGDDCVFVVNDWHSSPTTSYIKTMRASEGVYKNAKVAFCVHNIAYQGRFAASDFDKLSLPESFAESFAFDSPTTEPVPGPKINWMKAGFMESDKNFTVSPNYAIEVTSGPELGVEMADVINEAGSFTGIVNGMDVVEWNPATDKYLDTPYDETCVEVKSEIKAQLQAEVGLPVDPEIPLMVFVGRLEEQKGYDILHKALPKILENKCQVVVLGTGKKKYEKLLTALEEEYPDNARGIVKFNVPLAHMMTAGADFFLVPSRFEPCGLIQLHAMRYGTVPIVSSTGGLVDTVIEGTTGFHIGAMNVDCDSVDPLDVAATAETVQRALEVYEGQPEVFTEMIQSCMAQDLSWAGPAKVWEQELLAMMSPASSASSGIDRIEDPTEAKSKANAAAP